MKIVFFTTGGTIDKAYLKKKGTYNFDILEPSVRYILKNVEPNFKYEVVSLLKKDSLDINNKDRLLILNACKNVKTGKIIITHGTDTMLDTANKLSEIKDKVIILVGASQPERFKETDADFNVGMAVGAINVVPNGIYIAMNGRVYNWDECRKLDSGHFVEI